VVVRIEGGGEEEPLYRACLRGRAYRHWVYHPDRLKYPLKRVGERGEAKFERISWEEALDTAARELKRVKETYGNPAILFCGMGGGSNGALHGRRPGYRLLNMFGGCTTVWATVSNEGAIFASMCSYGQMNTGNMREDLVNSRLIILWGWNPADTIWDSGTSLLLAEARERGIKIVCLDPRYTNTAAVFATQWIPIIPGSDTAMLIAMAYTIIQEGLLDQRFLDTYTVGFDRFRDYVLGVEDGVAKTPAWAEPITGVPAATIENLAKEYASHKPAALIAGWAPGRTSYGEQFHRAAMALAAMTGNIGIHGGNAPGWEGSYPSLWNLRGMPVGKNPVDLSAPPRKNALPLPGGTNPTSARIPVTKIWDAILQGKAGGYAADIKLLWVLGNNPLNQLPDTNRGVAALRKLEFVLVQDQFMSATARFADILLPVNTFLEREDVAAPWLGAPYYVYVNKAIEPLYESKTDLEICTELASRLGIEGFNDKTEEEWVRWIVESCPDIPDYEEFKRKGIHRVELPEPFVSFKAQIEDPKNNPFRTPSGKIEIYSQLLADMNDPKIPPIPKYIEPEEGRNDPLAQKYPLQFISTHFRRRVHSLYEINPWLKPLEPQALWINPVDASPRGIRQGDLVRVFNDRGETIVPALVTERIMPGVVQLPEGGNYTPDENGVDRGGCPNVLTRSDPSPVGVFAANSCLVQVQKV
jgi:anaerobic dimethyl sulfoxide reductase subunit A